MIKNYFKTAFRTLLRNKTYSFINIIGLSIGLACAMLILLYVKDEVSYDRFHKNVSHIYRVVTESTREKGGEKRLDGNSGLLQGPRFVANVPGLESFVRIQSGTEDFKKGNNINSRDLLYVDSNFFSMFSFPVVYGNAKACLKDPYSVVLTEQEAKKQFGETNVIGKTMEIKQDGVFKPFTVTAVTRNTPQNSSVKFDILLPFRTREGDANNPESWFNFFLNTFVVVAPNANLNTVEKNMQRFYEADSKDALKIITEKYGPMLGSSRYFLQPMTDMHLNTQLPAQNGLVNASNPMYSYILSGIAFFILIIACINFINLTVARSVKRAKEIGIRKVIGGNRNQLIFQFLGESFFLCSFAFLFAIVLVQLFLPVFNELSNKALALSYLFDARLVAGYIVLFLLTGFLAGIYPALVLSSYKPVDTLYSRFILGGKNYLQKSLVVFQFALASFLIIATFVLYQQFDFLTHEKLGYDDTNLVSISKDGLSRNEASHLRSELLKSPSIIGVTARNGGRWQTRAKVNADSSIQFSYETVDENYIPLLQIPLLKGRNFSKAFPSDSSSSVLVNEAFVKKAGWKDPLKEQVDFWYDNKKYNVVGVVKDYHFESLSQEIGPQLFTMKKDNWYGQALIKIKPGTATESLRQIQKVFKQLFPLNPYSYTFTDEQNRKSYEAEEKWKQIMLFSAMLTIFISCIGLFGLSVLAAEKRTKEIGIRKVLGASVNGIVTILSKDFLVLVCIALLIAVPSAWMASDKWLQNYPYRISLSMWLFASASVLVVLIALFTVSFQAVKAAIANPVTSLRSE